MGHGTMVDPAGAEIMTSPCRGECAKTAPFNHYDVHWFTTGTSPGCPATGINCPAGGKCCETPMKPTLKSIDQLSYPKMISDPSICNFYAPAKYNNNTEDCVKDLESRQAKLDEGDVTASIYVANPWFAPGNSPVVDSCGVLGGWQYQNARDYIAGPGDGFFSLLHGLGGAVNTKMPPLGMDPPAGTLGTTVLSWEVNTRMQEAQGKSQASYPIVWTAGDIVDGSYRISANHGGGHQYRLCPLENLINGTLNEACFQANVMEFADGKSTFVGGSGDDAVNITFDAMDIDDSNTDGVVPKGSTWRKIGLPACADAGGIDCTLGPQFTDNAPPGYYGYGYYDSSSPDLSAVLDNWKIVDKLKIPEGLSGDYVVSWRWDSEQTPQVWTQCAIVTIVDTEDMLGDGDSDSDSDSDNDNDGDCQSLIDIVCSGKDFTIFCKALKATDLDDEFDKESWTFFIPNDNAFASIQDVLEPLSKDDITNILMFHVVDGKILESNDLQCTELIDMFNGDTSRTACNDGTIYQNGAGNKKILDAPQIIQTNIKFCNGVAHVIDGVMLP